MYSVTEYCRVQTIYRKKYPNHHCLIITKQSHYKTQKNYIGLFNITLAYNNGIMVDYQNMNFIIKN